MGESDQLLCHESGFVFIKHCTVAMNKWAKALDNHGGKPNNGNCPIWMAKSKVSNTLFAFMNEHGGFLGKGICNVDNWDTKHQCI